MEQQASNGLGPVFILLYLPIVLLQVTGSWKTFTKAGLPGWGILVPIYCGYLYLKLASRPVWWLVLLFVPGVNLVVWAIICIDVARRFGRGTGFGMGLCFLPFVFYMILGFGDASFNGAAPPAALPARASIG